MPSIIPVRVSRVSGAKPGNGRQRPHVERPVDRDQPCDVLGMIERVLPDHRRAHRMADQHDLVGADFRAHRLDRSANSSIENSSGPGASLWPWPGRSSVTTR